MPALKKAERPYHGGKLADFTVLSADIMKEPETEILNTKNVITIIGGRIVYEAK